MSNRLKNTYKLPPLPESFPAGCIAKTEYFYTAEQMQAYGRQCRDAAQAEPGIKVNTEGTVAVSQSVFWLPIDHNAPLGVRLLLINKDAGRATDGQLGSSETFFDHYQAFPKFKT